MRDLNWEDVAEHFEIDGSLLDAYVFDVSLADWQQVIDVVRQQPWQSEYTLDGSAQLLPADVHDIFEHHGDAATTLQIRPATTIQVNTHFFSADEIEFDFDRAELQGQDRLDVLCSFLRTIGQALNKPVVITPENCPTIPLLTYLPSADRVIAV